MGKYIEQNMGRGESLILKAKVHWTPLLLPIVIIITYIIGMNGVTKATAVSGTNGDSQIMAFALLGFVGFALLIKRLIQMKTTELAFTNKKILGKTGLINTNSLDAPLNKINNVSVSSGLLGKILGYGNIIISTSSAKYVYKGIAQADNFKANLMSQIDQCDEERIKKQAQEMAQAMKA